MNTDLFGYVAPRAPFKDIRSTRESVAEEKAQLCLQLGELCRRVPASINAGGIKAVRTWRADLERAKSVVGSKRASVNDLTTAIKQMRSYS